MYIVAVLKKSHLCHCYARFGLFC